jgi:RNA polymerase sigma-70 factor (ECF subfamily)
MDMTPISLLARLAQPAGPDSAAAAWSRFVELFAPLLYSWASRLGLQDHDAADLVQDVFVVLVRKLPDFRHDGQHSFRAWLHTVLMNRYRDRLRQPASPALPGPAVLDDLPAPDAGAAVEEVEYRRHLAQQALRLMQRDFQPATWRACWETKVCGRPAAEVAAELGLSVAATSRVLRRLRQELAGFLE